MADNDLGGLLMTESGKSATPSEKVEIFSNDQGRSALLSTLEAEKGKILHLGEQEAEKVTGIRGLLAKVQEKEDIESTARDLKIVFDGWASWMFGDSSNITGGKLDTFVKSVATQVKALEGTVKTYNGILQKIDQAVPGLQSAIVSGKQKIGAYAEEITRGNAEYTSIMNDLGVKLHDHREGRLSLAAYTDVRNDYQTRASTIKSRIDKFERAQKEESGAIQGADFKLKAYRQLRGAYAEIAGSLSEAQGQLVSVYNIIQEMKPVIVSPDGLSAIDLKAVESVRREAQKFFDTFSKFMGGQITQIKKQLTGSTNPLKGFGSITGVKAETSEPWDPIYDAVGTSNPAYRP